MSFVSAVHFILQVYSCQLNGFLHSPLYLASEYMCFFSSPYIQDSGKMSTIIEPMVALSGFAAIEGRGSQCWIEKATVLVLMRSCLDQALPEHHWLAECKCTYFFRLLTANSSIYWHKFRWKHLSDRLCFLENISSILLVRLFPHIRCYFGNPHFSLNIIFWTTKVDLLFFIYFCE
jgi:hypothetical protein